MKKFFLILGFLVSITSLSFAAVMVNEAAPGFTLTDSNGKTHSLADFSGKYVVLEWVNFDCPFVRKHYDSKNMQNLQKKYTDEGVVWLSINSSAAGKQGHFSNEEINRRILAEGASPSAYLVDTDGAVGKLYGAKTTPHMYVVDPSGQLIYQGGIDDIPGYKISEVSEAVNYVQQALDASMSGKEVAVATSQPYGCSVKY